MSSFSFGAPAAAKPAPFSFGAPAVSAFGAPAAAAPATTTGFGFNVAPTAAPPAPPTFGGFGVPAAAQQPAAPAFGGFGVAPPPVPSAFGLPAASAPFSLTAPAATSAFSFGGVAAAAATAPPPAVLLDPSSSAAAALTSALTKLALPKDAAASRPLDILQKLENTMSALQRETTSQDIADREATLRGFRFRALVFDDWVDGLGKPDTITADEWKTFYEESHVCACTGVRLRPLAAIGFDDQTGLRAVVARQRERAANLRRGADTLAARLQAAVDGLNEARRQIEARALAHVALMGRLLKVGARIDAALSRRDRVPEGRAEEVLRRQLSDLRDRLYGPEDLGPRLSKLDRSLDLGRAMRALAAEREAATEAARPPQGAAAAARREAGRSELLQACAALHAAVGDLSADAATKRRAIKVGQDEVDRWARSRYDVHPPPTAVGIFRGLRGDEVLDDMI